MTGDERQMILTGINQIGGQVHRIMISLDDVRRRLVELELRTRHIAPIETKASHE